MLARFDKPLPQHRYLGEDPDARPLWGKEQNGRASLIFTAILRAAFPEVSVFHLVRINIVPSNTKIATVCLEVGSQYFPSNDLKQDRRADLCARLALALLRPADYRPENPAKSFYYERSRWSLGEFTAHETIEQNAVLYEELNKAGREAKFLFSVATKSRRV
tara:strand:+ start:1169 stop:1654 length:486 start_codon:yes stop_codon:yes gene_type:complete